MMDIDDYRGCAVVMCSLFFVCVASTGSLVDTTAFCTLASLIANKFIVQLISDEATNLNSEHAGLKNFILRVDFYSWL